MKTPSWDFSTVTCFARSTQEPGLVRLVAFLGTQFLLVLKRVVLLPNYFATWALIGSTPLFWLQGRTQGPLFPGFHAPPKIHSRKFSGSPPPPSDLLRPPRWPKARASGPSSVVALSPLPSTARRARRTKASRSEEAKSEAKRRKGHEAGLSKSQKKKSRSKPG